MSDHAHPLFALRGVRARFEDHTVLSVDELELAEGKVTVLVGENGSGKTTLLRVLNGLMQPSAGCIEFRGKPVSGEGLAYVRSESVLVHQSPLLFRGSVGYNVMYGVRLKGAGRAEAEAKASEALRRVGLDGFQHRKTSTLSGGEKQRVALARALALCPRVLLLDEPTANVDAESRREVEKVIRKMSASGTTVIMSTHNRELGYRLCDRLVRLDGGVPADADENVLKGTVERIDEQFAYFRAGEALLRCPARQGSFVVAVLPCDEIILSPRPLASSARNQLPGLVKKTEPFGSLLRVTVFCGVLVNALVTREAASELGVEEGATCMVSFKASAVRLY
jgi:tungstate transport system ATP-binding protein